MCTISLDSRLIAAVTGANSHFVFFSTQTGQYRIDVESTDENELDAIIAAIAARETFTGRWGRDLASNRANCEQNPSTYWLSPVHYGWPGQ